MAESRNHSNTAGTNFPNRRTVLTALGGLGAIPLVAATGPAIGAVRRGPARSVQQEVVVDLAAERQTIRGFGGMNHTAWIDDLTATQRETAFGNADGQLGFSILRIPVHEDRANWQNELATAQAAVQQGARVIASPWNPPAEMVETFVRGDQTDAKRLRYDSYAAYAEHLNEFTGFMRDNGVELYGISVQNEPDYAHDWTWWTPEEMIRFLVENAGTVDARIIAPESFQYIKEFSDPILRASEALANMDILGAHLYGTAYEDFGYPLFDELGAGKERWMTEVYYPNSDQDSADRWPEALDVAEHIHHAMVDGDFQAYVWWYIRRNYGPMREDGQISKRGAMMAQFAKFVRPGHIRVDAIPNPHADVWISAYKGTSNAEVAIVAVNKGSSAVSQGFTLRGGNASAAAAWTTNAEANLAAGDAVEVSNGSFTAELPAQSVTTFVTE